MNRWFYCFTTVLASALVISVNKRPNHLSLGSLGAAGTVVVR
jgi:hypothetical protein